ncbi:MAG: hypothetical protein MR894_09475 [Akkermansia muciniphila]|nr:hypothetical protein [Akkermansia muciniphila]
MAIFCQNLIIKDDLLEVPIKLSGGSSEFVRDVRANNEVTTNRSATANSLWLDSGYYQNGTNNLDNFSGVSNMYITDSQFYSLNETDVTLATNLFLGGGRGDGNGIDATMRLDGAGKINFTGQTTLIGAAVIRNQVEAGKQVVFSNVDLNSQSITFANQGNYTIRSYSGLGSIIANGSTTAEILNYDFSTSAGVTLSSSANGWIKLSGYTGSGSIVSTGTTRFDLAGTTTADQTLTLRNEGTGTIRITATSMHGKLIVQSGTVQSDIGGDANIGTLELKSGTQMDLNAQYKYHVTLSTLKGEGTLVSACANGGSQNDGYRATVISNASEFTGIWQLCTQGLGEKNRRVRGILNTASFGGVVEFTATDAKVAADGSQLLLAADSSIAGLKSDEGLTNALIQGISDTLPGNDALRGEAALAKVDRTLTITGDKNCSFSGTVDSSISLIIDTGASQTLSGATINGSLQNKGALSISKAVEVTGSVSFDTGATLNILGAGEKLPSTYVPLQTSGLTDVTDSIKYTLFKGNGSITGLTADMISINDTVSTGGTLGEGSRDYTVSSTEKAYYVVQSETKTLSEVETTITSQGETVNRIYVEDGATLSGVNKMTTQNVVGRGVLQLTGNFQYWNDWNTCFNDFSGEVEIVGSDTLIHVGGAADRFKSSEGIKLKEGATLQVASGGTLATDVTIAEGKILTNWQGYTFSKVIVDGEATIDASPKNAGTINVANLEIKTGKLTTSGRFSSDTGATIAEGAELLSNGTTTLASLSGKGTLSSSSSTTVTEASGFTGTLEATGSELTVNGGVGSKMAALKANGGDITIFSASSVEVQEIVLGAGKTLSTYTGTSAGEETVLVLAGTADAPATLEAYTGATLNANLSVSNTTITLNGGALQMGSYLIMGSGNTLSGIDLSSAWQENSITLFTGVDAFMTRTDEFSLTASDLFSNAELVNGYGGYNYKVLYGGGENAAVELVRTATATPEPTTATLSLLALMGLAARRRRKAAK